MFRPRVIATKGGLAVLVQITFGCTGPNTNHPNPESCKDVRYNAIESTGEHPADGTYTVYGLGELQAPWQVYCDGMSGTPTDYLTVDPARNVGTLKIGDEIVLETRYERLRIDPSSFQLDLSDTRFATSTGTRHNLPPEWLHLPAGFAHYDATSLGGGVHAEAALDLTGTPFRFPQVPAADTAFCLSPPGDETIAPLFLDAEPADGCDDNTCWSGTCTTGPLTDAGSDDPRADMGAVSPPDMGPVSPPDAAATPDVSVVTPPDAAATPDVSVIAPADAAPLPPDAAPPPPDAAPPPPDAAPPPPALDCDTYCATLVDHCTGARSQFDSLAACVGFCRLIPQGTPDDLSGNTLGCRYNHAVLAAADPETECANAGPSGGGLDPMRMGGVCGEPCEITCAIGAAVCPAQFGECMMICPFFGALAGPHSAENTTRNDYGCRLNALARATVSPADAQANCPEAGFASMACSQ